MELILNNPYRITGLLVGATAKEQERQIKRLKQFIDAEQEPQDDFSFPSLGSLHRTIGNVTEAASKLNLDKDKMNAALFWFYNGNVISDEPAFDSLKNGGIKEAVAIWGKLVVDKEISAKNASAFFNWGTLFLNSAFHNKEINENHLEKGIDLKLKFLQSDFVKDFKAKTTDETFKVTTKEMELSFLNGLQQEIEKHGGLFSSKLIEILSKQNFSAKEEFLKSFVQKPIEQIEKKIEAAKTKRKANKANAASAGKELYNSVNSDLIQLKNILGTNDLKYSSISDKVSDEILQCGIDYFLHYRDSNTDPGAASMDLFKKAKMLATGNIVKQRCQENTDNLQEWIDDKPKRDKQQRIIFDLEKLKTLIDEYDGKDETVANAKNLLSCALPHLNNIKSILSTSDELYLGLSSRIASDAQGMCVSEINKIQDRLSHTYDSSAKLVVIFQLKGKVNDAWEVSTTIGRMDLRSDFRSRFKANHDSLLSLKTQLAAINTGGSGSSGGSGGGGCYIATMAYGEYNHPQVMILRQFRDERLDKTSVGKWFIKTYYLFSPKLVELLVNQKATNTVIRKGLDLIIKMIK